MILTDRVAFPPAFAAEHTFTVQLPENVPDNTRLLLRAFAVGQGEVRAHSNPRELVVVNCPENAVWCS